MTIKDALTLAAVGALAILIVAPPLWLGRAVDTHHEDALDGSCQVPAWPNDPCGRPEWCWRQGLACPPSSEKSQGCATPENYMDAGSRR